MLGAVAFVDGDKTAVVCSDDGSFDVWDLEARLVARTARPELWRSRIDSFCVSADRKHALTAGYSQRVRLWDLERCQERQVFEESGHGVRFTPDRRLAVVDDDRDLYLLDLESGTACRRSKDTPALCDRLLYPQTACVSGQLRVR